MYEKSRKTSDADIHTRLVKATSPGLSERLQMTSLAINRGPSQTADSLTRLEPTKHESLNGEKEMGTFINIQVSSLEWIASGYVSLIRPP